MSIGLLIIRLVLGLTLMGHGSQKLCGWFGGHGLKGTAGWLDSIGIKPGLLMALLAGIGELLGGFLFATGLYFWLGAVLIVITMLVALFKVHLKNGYWITEGGFEYLFLIIVVAIGLFITGPGTYVL